MRTTHTSFIDPSSLSSPSQPPSTRSSTVDPSPAPPRKRPRSDLSQEERKESRAHRNRIAAQNSRDRKKVQFTYLEQRVAELEEENRQLRASMGLSEVKPSADMKAQECDQQKKSREKENEELRERIKTLEKGWDAVIKALTAQGFPASFPILNTSCIDPSLKDDCLSDTSLFTRPASAIPDSPTPSLSSASSVLSEDVPAAGGFDTTQIALEANPSPISNVAEPSTPIDEAIIDELFHQLLVPSPLLPPSTLPLDPLSVANVVQPSQVPTSSSVDVDWDSEAEMQRLLDMLPNVQSVDLSACADSFDFTSTMDLDHDEGWQLGLLPPSNGIGVF